MKTENILVGKSEAERSLIDLGIDEKMLLKGSSNVYARFIWLRIQFDGGQL